MATYYKFQLDLEEDASQATITIPQGDVGTRYIDGYFTFQGEPYWIVAGSTVTFSCKKPDGTVVYTTAGTIKQNYAEVLVTSQMLASAGECECEFEIIPPTGGRTTSPHFTLFVTAATMPAGAVESTDEYAALDQRMTYIDTVYNAYTSGALKGEKGDAGAGATVKQTTGQSTDDVMSQKACTDTFALKSEVGSKIYILPEDYGAVGDGTTDDTAALQSALDAAYTAKKPVYLTNHYKVTTSLNGHGWFNIIGSNPSHTGNISRITFTPSAAGTRESPASLFVNTGAADNGQHNLSGVKIINTSGTFTACFGYSCPLAHGSMIENSEISGFSVVFNTYIQDCSHIRKSKFYDIKFAFLTKNIQDAYISDNYISAYRPFAPFCFYGGYITHCEISHNFFDFWFGVFEYGMNSKFIDNIFDYCFMAFGYVDQIGNANNTTGISKNIYECVISGNIFPNCAGCATSAAGFGTVRDTIRTSHQGAVKDILLDHFPATAICIAGINYTEGNEKAIPYGYYYTFSNTVTGNNFMGDGFVLCCTNANGFNISGNQYGIPDGISYIEELSNVFISLTYNSNTGNRKKPCYIDLLTKIPYQTLPTLDGDNNPISAWGASARFSFLAARGLEFLYNGKHVYVTMAPSTFAASYIDALGDPVTA